MSTHKGEHPRMGATDVCPFIPVANISMEETAEWSKKLAAKVGGELNIPVYLYEEAQKDKLETLLDEFSLNRVRKNRGDVLSGGERRRTEIARALAVNPKFILLDEPFAGVDPIAVEDIQAIVSKLVEKNIGILITDHNVHETLNITNRAYLLFEGKILKAGTAEELAADEQVRRVYLGQNFELRR